MWWTQDHLDDIASDLSVFHRIDDWTKMRAADYFDKAERLGAYAGVIQARATIEQEQHSKTTPATGASPRYQAPAQTGGTTTVEGTRGAIETNVSTAGLIDWE